MLLLQCQFLLINWEKRVHHFEREQHLQIIHLEKKQGSREWRNIFKSFWNTEDWQAQSNYIAGCVKTSEPQRKSVLNSRVKFVRQYHLADIRVCKDVFLKTLQITDGRVDYCLNRKTSNGACSPDKLGSSSKNKTSAEKKQLVSDFLNSFCLNIRLITGLVIEFTSAQT